MGWRENQDALIAAGIGPEDEAREDPIDPPSSVVITVYRDEICIDGIWHQCPTCRAFPLFAEKAALRWADYWRRKIGAKNVCVDYE